MVLNKIKPEIAKSWMFYLIGFASIFAIKYSYSISSVNELDWILKPTAWWVEILSTIPFEKAVDMGFVNHEQRIVIAQSCSGVNFLIILFSTLLFSFIHRFKTGRSKVGWLFLSAGLAYLVTILVNGLRIILSIYLFKADIYNGWITPVRIHRIEGTAVYLLSLFIIYTTVERIINCQNQGSIAWDDKVNYKKLPINMSFGLIQPLCWYFLITLGIPILNGSYKNETGIFYEHAIIVLSICLVLTSLACVFIRLNNNFICKIRKF